MGLYADKQADREAREKPARERAQTSVWVLAWRDLLTFPRALADFLGLSRDTVVGLLSCLYFVVLLIVVIGLVMVVTHVLGAW